MSRVRRLGLCQVFPPEGTVDNTTIDIIAIHGLETESPHTWVFDNGTSKVNWLSDSNMLPSVVPNARIYTYDWNAKVFSNASVPTLLDHADNLLGLVAAHRYDTPNRPLVFVASCFGGLVLAEAVHRAAQKGSPYAHVLQATVGAIFLATPFAGTDAATPASWLVTIKGIVGNEASDKLIQDLERRHDFVQQRIQQFAEIANADSIRLSIWCFFETLTTNIARMIMPSSLSRFASSSFVLVERSSACLDGFPRHALNARHSTMNKFSGPNDSNFQLVSQSIRKLVDEAEMVLRRRNKAEGHVLQGSAQGRALPPSALSPKPLFLVPFGQNECFVGREDIIGQLIKVVPPTATKNNCQRVVIEGLGGIGKTQVAIETTYRVRDAFPDCSIFWVPALSAVMFENAYRTIGQRLNIEGIDDPQRDVKALVRDALSQEDAGHWLLIIDNADDMDILFNDAKLLSYLPFSRKGSVLITTRNHKITVNLPSSTTILKLETLSDLESTQLLQQGLQESQIGDQQSTLDLVEYLARLPLALRQASAYMRSNRQVSTSEYLTRCKLSDKTMIRLLSQNFDDQDQYEATRRPVATTWLVSFDQISRDTPLAAEYLKFLSCLAEKNIPLSILPPEEDPLAVDEAVGTLIAYSFITPRDTPDTFDMHRLVRLIMQSWLDQRGLKAGETAKTMQRLLTLIPQTWEGDPFQVSPYTLHAQAVLDVADDKVDQGTLIELLDRVAFHNGFLGKFDQAEHLFRRALRNRQQWLGPKHPSTLESMTSLADSLRAQGKMEEATQTNLQALKLSKEEYGDDHPTTIRMSLQIGNFGGFELPGLENGEQLFHRALAHEEAKFDGWTKFLALKGLVNALIQQGKNEEAERWARLPLEDVMEIPGSNVLERLGYFGILVDVLYAQEKYDEAVALLEPLKNATGSKRVHACIMMESFANRLGKRGKFEAAGQIFQHAIGSLKELLGPQHFMTVGAQVNLFRMLHRQGKDDAAEQICKEVLELTEGTQGYRSDVRQAARKILRGLKKSSPR